MTLEYKEGYQAYLDGEGLDTNPYKYGKEQSDPEKFVDWLSGWRSGWRDERKNKETE